MSVWYLEITSWRGISFGATHWYGLLRSGLDEYRDEIHLERVLSSKEVRDLNRADPYRIAGQPLYRVGDKTKGFNDRESVIEAAKRAINPNDILILGNWSAADPQEVIVGPPELVDLYRQWKGWDDPEADRIANEWGRCLKALERECPK